MTQASNDYGREVKQLAEVLGRSPLVTKLGNDEVPTLAIALADIEGSMWVFLENQLPRLKDPNLTYEQLEDLLFEIREEFRHIAYHFHDPQFFRVIEPTHEWLSVKSYDA
jgi:hypothetical protein